MTVEEEEKDNKEEKVSRRDFMVLTAGSMAAVGAACSMWPMVDSLNPASDTMALSSIEVDISNINPGQITTVKWRGKPVFIKRRTKQEIAEEQVTKLSQLKDPQTAEERVQKGHEEWLVVVGICTHLGCIPIGGEGKYDGWLCPCHGSVYDGLGRIRQGPAPTNLEIPPYKFITDTKIKIG